MRVSFLVCIFALESKQQTNQRGKKTTVRRVTVFSIAVITATCNTLCEGVGCKYTVFLAKLGKTNKIIKKN